MIRRNRFCLFYLPDKISPMYWKRRNNIKLQALFIKVLNPSQTRKIPQSCVQLGIKENQVILVPDAKSRTVYIKAWSLIVVGVFSRKKVKKMMKRISVLGKNRTTRKTIKPAQRYTKSPPYSINTIQPAQRYTQSPHTA